MKLVYLLIFFMANVYAIPNPPHPNPPLPPGGPKVSIDDYFWYLVFAAITYGLYVIYSRKIRIQS